MSATKEYRSSQFTTIRSKHKSRIWNVFNIVLIVVCFQHPGIVLGEPLKFNLSVSHDAKEAYPVEKLEDTIHTLIQDAGGVLNKKGENEFDIGVALDMTSSGALQKWRVSGEDTPSETMECFMLNIHADLTMEIPKIHARQDFSTDGISGPETPAGCPKERSQVSFETAMKSASSGVFVAIGQFLVGNGMAAEDYLAIAVRYWVRLLEESSLYSLMAVEEINKIGQPAKDLLEVISKDHSSDLQSCAHELLQRMADPYYIPRC